MEKNLFSFIWKYSKREQFLLLGLTLVTFPFLFATLELPKRIINDAIGSSTSTVDVFGFQIDQIMFLWALCFGYLAAVIIHGLLKMRLNTMKGIVAERMLRRLRYTLLSRLTRFPRSYFQTTSQGELVSMVTSEAEPMGGLMGDALAQPVFQAGQMLIIVFFLFLQSFWFGLASISLIPLQAWLIPLLQRQINLLNKERISEVRAFASEIGETAAGITDLRTNGGLRYRLAMFSDRLGRLFDVRFRIYTKKFFMKFLNNFINQLTPFFFYAVGGYLAIRGEITVGALVAALAAYKDLSSPWKELLTYYNQTQDMSLRWQIVTERFDPAGMLDAELFEGEPKEATSLKGDIVFDRVNVRSAENNLILEDISLKIPAGGRVAIKSSSQTERAAFSQLLTREVLPRGGTITINDHPLNALHQATIARQIGYAHSRPYLFDGTLGENLLMPLTSHPNEPGLTGRTLMEAEKSGSSTDTIHRDWVDPARAQLKTADEIRAWWFEIIGAMGIDEFMFRSMLTSRMAPELHQELADHVVAIRPRVEARLREEGLLKHVHRFDPAEFNPSVPLGANLLFVAPRQQISQEELVADGGIISVVGEAQLSEAVIGISQTIMEILNQTFGRDGTSHPLFQRLEIDPEQYEGLIDIAMRRRERGDSSISQDEFAMLMTVPFAFTAEQIGSAFPDTFKKEILRIRKSRASEFARKLSDKFVQIAPENYLPRLTILENALYGRISMQAGAKTEKIEAVVAEIMTEEDLRRAVAETVFDFPTGIAGSNIPTVFHERVALSRAALKRPDILILDRTLASNDAEARRMTRNRLRDLLTDTTLIFLEEDFANPEAYDLFVEIKNGRIEGINRPEEDALDETGADDLRRKVNVISRTELFEGLDTRNRRLLAFAAQWYTAMPEQRIFSMNEAPDAAYLCVAGKAELCYETEEGEMVTVTTVEPGRLIGDLAIIMDEPRQLHLVAKEWTTFLRIGADEFRAVIEADTKVLMSLLQTVAGHLMGAAELLRQSQVRVPQDFGPSPPPLE